MCLRTTRTKRMMMRKKTSDRKVPSLSLITIHVRLFSSSVLSTCTLFGLLDARDALASVRFDDFCILMMYLSTDKRVSYWSQAYI